MESFITIITTIFYAFKVVIHLTVILCPVLPDHLFSFLFIFCKMLQCWDTSVRRHQLVLHSSRAGKHPAPALTDSPADLKY